MATARRIALLAPMLPELRPLLAKLSLRRRGRGATALYRGDHGAVEVVAALTGIGCRAAALATERVLDAAPVDHVMVVGIAGAIASDLAIGDVVAPEKVVDLASGREHRPWPGAEGGTWGSLVTSDQLITDAGEIDRLRRAGAVAIDMETSAVAAVCEKRRRPWSVYRAVSDRAGDPAIDPALLRLAGSDGGLHPGAIARFVVTHPWRVPDLARLGRGMRVAADAAATAAVLAIERSAKTG